MRNVLFIAYYYAPMNNGGVHRPVKFAAYLPRYGYRAIVATVDVGLTAPGEKDILRFADPMDAMEGSKDAKSLFWQGVRAVAWRAGMWPGWRRLWQRAVLDGLSGLLKAADVQLIFATYPIVDNLAIGLEVAGRHSIPLVADFRDGLAFEPVKSQPPLVSKKYLRVESEVVNRAAAVTAVSDPITNYFCLQRPGCNAVTITNGFDRSDYEHIKPRDLGGKMNIVFTGRLYKSRAVATIEPLLKAAASLQKDEQARLAIQMVGDFTEEEKALFGSDRYRDLVRCDGPVPREEALTYQVSADVLLLFAGEGIASAAPGKLYEYFGARKPILALTAGSEAERFIGETRTGICVNPYRVEEIAAVLRKIIAQKGRYDFFQPDYDAIDRQYSSEGLTGKLAAVFDSVLSGA